MKKHIIVTAGGTREYIDNVRFIGNRSTGRMGIKLAKSAKGNGFSVDLVYANGTLLPPKGCRLHRVETSNEMYNKVKSLMRRDTILIMAAAVSDFRPERTLKTKIKKNSRSLTLKLVHTVDILKELGKRKKKNQILVGFAAGDKDIITNAKKKLEEKNLDFIVANLISRKDSGFGAKTNRATIILNNGSINTLPLMTKSRLAVLIINLIKTSYT